MLVIRMSKHFPNRPPGQVLVAYPGAKEALNWSSTFVRFKQKKFMDTDMSKTMHKALATHEAKRQAYPLGSAHRTGRAGPTHSPGPLTAYPREAALVSSE